MEKKVVILGAGFGGVRVALNLLKIKGDFRVILVNDSPSHCYHPDLYEVAATTVKHDDKLTFEHLMGTVSVPLTDIFINRSIDILIDQVEAIDLGKKDIILSQTGKISYDYLVITLGSSTNFLGIEGAPDYSHTFKTTEDALNVHNDLYELGGNEKVVIAGGGFTGVELAGSLADFLKGKATLSVVEGSEKLLNGMPEWAQQMAQEKLKKLGVKLYLNCPISKVGQSSITCKGGEEIPYDYLVWTTGVQGDSLPGWIEGVEFNRKGQIKVSEDLSVPDHPEVFVLGDMAEVMDLKNGVPVPQTAWAAIAEGEVVAKNLIRRMNGQSTLPFTPPKAEFVVPVGRHFALSNALGLKVYGLLAWLIKAYIALSYFLSILPLAKALQTWWMGVKVRVHE